MPRLIAERLRRQRTAAAKLRTAPAIRLTRRDIGRAIGGAAFSVD